MVEVLFLVCVKINNVHREEFISLSLKFQSQHTYEASNLDAVNFKYIVQGMLLVFIIWIGICSNASTLTEEHWTGNEIMINFNKVKYYFNI